MDRTAVNAVEDQLGIGLDRAAAGFVLAGTDDQDPNGRELGAMLAILRAHDPISAEETTPERGEELAEICQNWLDGARARLAARRPQENSDDETNPIGETDETD